MKGITTVLKQLFTVTSGLAMMVACSLTTSYAQTGGITESSLILNINGGGNTTYDLQSSTANPDFNAADLGTFTSSQSIRLSGAKQKTFKCGGCGISGSTLYYRVYEIYSLPGVFNSVNIPLQSNDTGGCGGNQSWQLTSNATNILNGLNSGTYYLEVYTDVAFNNCGSGIIAANNNGLNYKATFTVNGIIAQYAGITTAATTTATGTANTPVTLSNGTITNLCTNPVNIMRTTIAAFNQSTATNYIEFSVKPQPGYQFTVSSIKINSRKSGGGPKNGRIDYNPNNTGFVTGTNYLTSATTGNCTSTVPQQPVNVSGVNITDTVNGLVVRVYYWSLVNTVTGVLDYSNLIVEGIVSEVNGLPKLGAPTATTASPNSAVLGAYVVSASGSPVTARGTVYKTTPGVTATDNQLAEGGTDIGAFSHTRSGLNPQTLYYYAGYATNGYGTSLSAESSFRTRSKTPLSQASNLTATPVSFSSVNLSWDAATFPASGASKLGYLVIYSTGTPSIIAAPGGLPPASIIANGTIVATIDSDSPSQPAITTVANGLAGNTAYNFMVVPYTWNGTSTNTYSYLIANAPTATATTLATSYSWIGTGTASWNTPANWQPNGVPTNTDAVIFNNTGVVTVSNVPDVSLTSLTVTGNSSVTLLAPATGGSSVINLYNAGEALNIAQGASLSLSGNGSDNMAMTFTGTGNNANINGTLNLLKAATTIGVANYNATNSNTSVNGVLRRESSAALTSTAANLTINQGGRFRLTGSGLAIPTATWQSGSTCEIAVTNGGTLTGLSQTFSNFAVNCPALANTIQCNGMLVAINDTFNIINTNYAAGKTFALTNTTAYTLNLNGDLIINDNACLDITNGSPVPTGVSTLNLKGNITITGAGLLEQSGSADAFINLVKPTGNQFISLAGSNSISQSEFSATINIGNGNTANKVKFNTNVSLGSFYISNVTVNNGATLDFGSYVLSGLGSNINVTPGAILRIGNANGISASANSGNIQMSGDRIFSDDAIYTYSGNVNQVTGDGLPANASSFIIDNTGPAGNNTVSLSNSISTAMLSLSRGLFNPNGKTQTIAPSGILNSQGGNFSPASTGTVAFSTGSVSGNVDFYPDVKIKGAVDFGANSTIYNLLQLDNGGYVTTNAPAYASASILKYNSGGTYSRGLEWSSTIGAGFPYNIQVRNNTTVDLSANGWANRVCAGYLNIGLGCSLTMGAMTNYLSVGKQLVLDGSITLSTATGGDIHVGGNWTRNSTGVFIPNNRYVFLEGITSSNINGSSPDASFDYLVLYKEDGSSVTINKDITIKKGLTFTNGIINTASFKVIIPQTSSVTRSAGHVNGNLQKYFASGTAVTQSFEIGDVNLYAPVTLKLATVNTPGNLVASTRQGDHPGIASTVFDGAKTINRYWTLTNAGISFTTCNPTFNFDVTDADAGVITDSIFCAKIDTASWIYPAMGGRTVTSTKLVNITSFGDFQLGNKCTSPTLTSSVTGVSCRNGNNGVINLNAAGGSPPFNYLWSNGASTQNIINCTAGTYTVTVAGQGGCSKTATIVVTQPASGIVVTATNNTPVCAGSAVNLSGTASGGTGALSYSWTGPNGFASTVSNPSINNAGAIASGTYQLKVTDANNCLTTKPTTVTVNAVTPVITGSATFCDGSSTVLSTGSYISYLWSTGAVTSSVSVNATNTYTVTVTAANGCTGSGLFVATAIPVLTPTIAIAANTGLNNCSGSPVTFTATTTNGGNTPVYKWKKNNLVVGTNSPTYTDAGLISGDVIKCTLSCPCATVNPVTSNLLTMAISQPIPVSAGNGPLTICGTGTATVFGKINNATSGYNGTWSTTSGGGTFSNTAWNGVSGITYTASVSDAGKTIYLVLTGPISGSCAGVKDSIAINVMQEVSITTGTINAVCKGASSFTIPYTSVTGYPYLYSLLASGPNPMPGFVNQIDQPLAPNEITVTIPSTVNAGVYNFKLQVAGATCQSVLYNLQLTVNANPVISISSSSPAVCQGTSATLTATGAEGYNWIPGFLDGASVSVAPSTATTYTVTGTNALGCTSTATISISVNALPAPVVSGNAFMCYGGSTVLGGGPGYSSYAWSNGKTNQNITVSSSNTYTVTVTNLNNCSASASKEVAVLPQINVTATSNVDSIHAGDTVQLNSTATGSVSGISYAVTSTAFAPLTGTATKVALGDDQMSGALPIGFNFVFYGNTYNNFYISSNGFITFNAGSNDGCCQGPPIPNNNNGNVSNMISLAWNDLNAAGGIVDYFTTGPVPNRKLVVRFNISHINGDPVIVQAILFEGTNNIEIHATNIPNMLYADPSYISTMGVENDGGTVATTVPGRNGTCWAATNDAWKFVPSASYNYSWNPSTGLSNINIKNPIAIPLSSTTYMVTATAYNGCTGSATKFIYVDQPSTLTAYSSATLINCNGATANVTVNALGGVTPYTGTGNYAVTAGTYTYTVTDAAGQSTTTSITIGQPPLLVVTASSTPIACNGDNAIVTVSAAGGTPPYSGTGTFSVIAGNYTYTVTDAKGCTSSVIINVNQPNVLAVSSNATPINCYGAASTVTVTATGGTIPYSGTGNYSVQAGAYTYTVIDAKGCSASTSVAISQPAVLEASSYGYTTVCYHDSATVTVIASGGTPPYIGLGNYRVPAGTYNFIVIDSKGCTSSTAITITELPQLISTINLLQNVSCNGKSDGKITVTGSNGSAPYMYEWNDGTTNKALSALTAGTYTVSISDNNGCSISTTYTVTQPDNIVITGNTFDVSCNGGNNGSASISVTGGTLPYSYLWVNGNMTSSLSSLSAGNYKVTVTDANGCNTSLLNNIAQPTVLSVPLVSSNVSCNGSANGNASVTVSGATPPYSYLWSTATTNAVLNNLGPGIYTITVSDSKGCTTVKSATITQPAVLLNSLTKNDVICNGGSSGSLTSNPTGGNTPYSYLWNTGTTTKIEGGLAAGTYTVTVTDSKGCSRITSETVSQPASLTYTSSFLNVTCYGSNNGTAGVNPSGGVTPYNYQWSNGATITNIGSLAPASYIVTITDNNGCNKSKTFTITEPTQLVLSNAIDNLSCNGAGDGKVTTNPAGGTTPYSYLWNTGDITKINSALAAGTYTVTVTDNKGCTKTASSVVTQPNVLNVNSVVTNVNCNGNANGSIINIVTGGISPYTYLWNGANTTLSRTGLTAGNYTVTVTDANGCTNKITNAVTQPAALTITGAGNNITCYGAGNGNASGAASGGTLPYTYLWSTSAVTSSINNLLQGTYTVTVTDNKGCASNKSYTITEPVVLSLSVTSTNITCNGANNGSGTASPAGGNTPYTYQWSSGITTKMHSNMIASNYTVTVTDSKGCTASSNTSISEPAPLAYVSNLLKNVSCNGGNNGKIDWSVTGGTMPYSYLWNNGATTRIVSTLTAGLYTMTATDNKGCTISGSYNVTQPPVLALTVSKTNPTTGSNNGSATANPSGGTSPYTYSWSTTPVKTSATITGLGAGAYTVTVTDFNGCTQAGSTALAASRHGGGYSDDLIIKVMPNPSDGEFVLKINTISERSANVELTDATSRIAYKEKIPLNSGLNEKLINVNSIAKGIYFFKVTTENKSEVIQVIIK